MGRYYVKGGKKLKGEVIIDGSKNSSLPIIAACSLIKGTTILKNVPNNKDVLEMLSILEDLGAKIIWKSKILIISNKELSTTLSYKNIRASYYYWGVLVSRYGFVKGFLPGGCNLGERPIDIHLDAFRDLGYRVSVKDMIQIEGSVKCSKLILKGKSVGATINSILASLNSKNEVIILNTLIEPEVSDLIFFLNKAGFQIEKIVNGLKITPRKPKPVEYEIMPDRIEALSYIVLGLLNGKIYIKNINSKNIKKVIEYLVYNGAKIKMTNEYILVKKSKMDYMKLVFDSYPGFPTDLNSIFIILLLLNEGGELTDRIFPDRYKSVEGLKKLGANMKMEGNLVVEKSKINGGKLKGLDLRGDMAFLILALSVKGNFNLELNNIDRGYPNFVEKLKRIGGKIKTIQ